MNITSADCHPEIREEEFKRLLGVPADYVFEGPMEELRAWVADWYSKYGHPWFHARWVDGVGLADGVITAGGFEMRSGPLYNRFRRAAVDAAVVVAVGAGEEAETEAQRMWRSGFPDRYYFLEVYASAVVEALVAGVGSRICAWAGESGLGVVPPYSPGYHGWMLKDQRTIFSLLTSDGQSLPGPLEILESGMPKPKKSQLAIFGLTRDSTYAGRIFGQSPCDSCSLVRCDFRRQRTPVRARQEPFELETIP